MKKDRLRKIVLSLLAATLFSIIAGSGILFDADALASDALYQRERATDGQIIVVGMDQEALDTFGPMPWSRSVVASAIDYLNSSPDGAKPAVIAIDTLYVGESTDPDADAMLADAARRGGNVVVAGAATFGNDLIETDDGFSLDERSVVWWDAPFEELSSAARVGHINTMADEDGMIRHGLLSLETPDGETVYSFSRVIYEAYCEALGFPKNPMPETTEDFFYIPYHTKSRGYYDGISIADLVNGTIDPSFFADKIVLLGPYAAGLQDEYRTAIDHAAPMYGVEIQANLIDAFRDGFYPKEASAFLQTVLVFLISFVTLLFFYDRRVRSAVIYEVAVSLGCILLCMGFYRADVILHVLYVPLFVTILFVASVALNYIRAQRERRRVTNTFGHYVDPAVMEELLSEGTDALSLGGKLRDIAVLFVDVRGFTTMSEALDPPTVVEIINRYLTLTTECIMKNHGTLDKFVGDCTMAFWNAPVEQEDPVYLACAAAMDMVEGSIALGKELEERFGRSVSFGIGVNYGPAVVGNIGAPLRMDYTAIGDTVNTAARLEANAPGGQILISRAVADILGDRAEVTSLGASIKLKGKAEGFEILTLDKLKS